MCADEMRKSRHSRRIEVPVHETVYSGMTKAQVLEAHDKELRFLDKVMSSAVVTSDDWEVCSITQSSTFFTKQGRIMDKSIGSNFKLPAAALQTFISLSIVIFIPIYDRVFVPIARAITEKPAGITMLQRIGCGMFLSVIAMVVATVVEKKRLQVAIDSGLLDIPIAMVPMLGAIAYWELGSRMSQGLYLRIFTAISTIGSMLLCL
ncbi:hypothetical protein IFM89_007250 [Coptis chinensis]|uniref:Uncharacterized protein n=1 Tax=Coptis chinensis TaxID=261450 RepID=A0A835INK2_9MAGN|nr:hypothetical protein IFM89_007250 [Coptis chinensis]